MGKLYKIVFFLLCWSINAQEATPSQLIDMGIKYHDRGDYEEAVKYYDMALIEEPQNELALLEKSYSLNQAKDYQNALISCVKVIDLKPRNKNYSVMAYLHCASSYDGLKNEKMAIKMFDKAAEIEPKNHSIFFNKGITYLNYSKIKLAENAFKKALLLKPSHPSSLYRLSYLAFDSGEKIPAILGFLRFLVTESTSKRSTEVARDLLITINSGISKNEEGTNLQIVAPQKGKEDFTTLDTILVLSNSMNQSEELKNIEQLQNLSSLDIFIKQLKIITSGLKDEKNQKKDFYRPNFTSYFSKMGEKEIEVLARTIFAANNEQASIDWIRAHSDEVEEFYNFSNKNF